MFQDFSLSHKWNNWVFIKHYRKPDDEYPLPLDFTGCSKKWTFNQFYSVFYIDGASTIDGTRLIRLTISWKLTATLRWDSYIEFESLQYRPVRSWKNWSQTIISQSVNYDDTLSGNLWLSWSPKVIQLYLGWHEALNWIPHNTRKIPNSAVWFYKY